MYTDKKQNYFEAEAHLINILSSRPDPGQSQGQIRGLQMGNQSEISLLHTRKTNLHLPA